MFFNLLKCHHLNISKNLISQSYTMESSQGKITIESVDSEKDLCVITEAYNSTNGAMSLETTYRRKVPSHWLADSSINWHNVFV